MSELITVTVDASSTPAQADLSLHDAILLCDPFAARYGTDESRSARHEAVQAFLGEKSAHRWTSARSYLAAEDAIHRLEAWCAEAMGYAYLATLDTEAAGATL